MEFVLRLSQNFGFGFIEVGTVTPLPQSGNPRPRLFRLKKDLAIINRMGFNNDGIDQLIKNLKKQKYKCKLGINIGVNKDTTKEKIQDDYLICFDKSYELADYIAVNISSPNTPGLRDFGESDAFFALLDKLISRRQELKEIYNKEVPILVKISPEQKTDFIDRLCNKINNSEINGIIVSNTTISRENLVSKNKEESGGLSGVPLKPFSNNMQSLVKEKLYDSKTLIGVGGIFSGKDGREKIEAGANLIQIYTGFIYNGLNLLTKLRENRFFEN